MIRTAREYHAAQETLAGLQRGVAAQRAEFEQMGLTTAEVERGLQPVLSLVEQVAAEMRQYESWDRGHVEPISGVDQLGRLLIALRIARGWSQRELASRLGVSETQVSRDERNEYHAVQVDRAQRILDTLGFEVTLTATEQAANQRTPALAGAH
jgi:DNA-binding XRE family transcriptional regulator